MKTSALLVIDAQVGPFNFPPEVYDASRLIDTVNNIANAFRKDGGTVVFIQHCLPEGSPMSKGGPAWCLHPSIEANDSDLRVNKTAGDSFFKTDLELLLRGRGITDVYLTGYASELCVDATARRSISLGFKTFLVTDGHSTKDRPTMKASEIIQHQNWVLSNLAMPGNQVSLVNSSDLLKNA